MQVIFSAYSSALMGERQRKRKLQDSPAGDGKLLKDSVSNSSRQMFAALKKEVKIAATLESHCQHKRLHPSLKLLQDYFLHCGAGLQLNESQRLYRAVRQLTLNVSLQQNFSIWL